MQKRQKWIASQSKKQNEMRNSRKDYNFGLWAFLPVVIMSTVCTTGTATMQGNYERITTKNFHFIFSVSVLRVSVANARGIDAVSVVGQQRNT